MNRPVFLALLCFFLLAGVIAYGLGRSGRQPRPVPSSISEEVADIRRELEEIRRAQAALERKRLFDTSPSPFKTEETPDTDPARVAAVAVLRAAPSGIDGFRAPAPDLRLLTSRDGLLRFVADAGLQDLDLEVARRA